MKLEEIRKLIDGATPGPWRTYAIYGSEYGEVFGPSAPHLGDRIPMNSQADADFIAASRTLMPRLLIVAEIAKRFVPPEGTIQWDLRETQLRDALAALEAEGT